MAVTTKSHSSHWGSFEAVVEDGKVVAVTPNRQDADPSPLLANIPGSTNHKSRIAAPMVRKGWLEKGPGSSKDRGSDTFIEVSWEQVTELLATELKRVLDTTGPESIYGGSYGWASAGRFHHAQSQLHRFLNLLGGYVSSVYSYSFGAGEVILDRVMGSASDLMRRATSWSSIVSNCDCFVSFGGIPIKNSTVNAGGVSRHTVRGHLLEAAANGVEFVHFSPIRDDVLADLNSTWHPIRPGSDTAVMLAIAYVLETEGLADRDFLDRYTVGYERFRRYFLGETDGIPKTPEWAEPWSEIPAATIRETARTMARGRTIVNVSWSLQRTDHGEQPAWLGLVLAAMLGQPGLPGGGYGFGYGSVNSIGATPLPFGLPIFAQGHNPVKSFIPVARISDMLLNPGESFDFNGQHLTYPKIELIYWAGGNPFHHHQDLGRLRRALAQPATIVVQEPFWTGMARHADIVLPTTVTLERNDIGAAGSDPTLTAMRQAVEPFGEARNDFDILRGLAAKLGFEARFAEDRTESEWLRHLYERWQENIAKVGVTVPEFDEFWARGEIDLPAATTEETPFSLFRADPEANPLRTPSGKIEIFSETIDDFGYDDCPGHPAWFEPAEWLGSLETERFPLQLIANNPRTRLHSQLDMGGFSQASKIEGREPVRLHPDDAIGRGIADGDVVRLFNDRGSALAGAVVTIDVRPGVIQLSTGAWFDPLDPAAETPFCVHGNPNVLTPDRGTSRLAQGCTGQHALVQLERWNEPLPPIRAYDPPVTI
ncbi:MAG: molybdopterin-dependent oxidoreductase [Thermomicrobiales bacterium]